MIEKSEKGGIVVLKLAYGKANTMDLEFCQAMIDEFTALRLIGGKGRGADRAGQYLLCGR